MFTRNEIQSVTDKVTLQVTKSSQVIQKASGEVYVRGMSIDVAELPADDEGIILRPVCVTDVPGDPVPDDLHPPQHLLPVQGHGWKR